MDIDLCSLDYLFQQSDVVSLHPPLLDTTHGMVTGQQIGLMKRYASLINTSRGAIIKQDELVHVLQERPDLTAVLDVTDPEPPRLDDAILRLPNVMLTPHIAGSMGAERRRMGRFMRDELGRYLRGEALQGEVRREEAVLMA